MSIPFQIGRSYLTRNNRTATITAVVAPYVYGKIGSESWTWYLDGRVYAETPSDHDLTLVESRDTKSRVADAVKDIEEVEGINDHIAKRKAALDDRLDKHEAMLTDLFRQVRGIRENQTLLSQAHDGLNARVSERLIDASKDIGSVERAIEKAHEANSNTVAEVRRLSDLIAQDSARIADVERNAEDRMDRITTGYGERFERGSARIAAIESQIASLEDLLTAAPEAVKAQAIKIGATNYGRRSLGWVNVYPGDRCSIWPTKDQADTAAREYNRASVRLACVEIFEGDGI